MSTAQRQKRQRLSARERMMKEERERQAAMELHEIQQLCAEQCGLQLATVTLGPQYDPRSTAYRGLPMEEVGRPDPKIFGKELHGRKVVVTKGFDPRLFNRNTRLDYYQVPTESY